MQSEAEKLAKQSEQLKANEQRFEELLREEPSLGETYGSMDCKRWEVEQTPGAIGSEETFDHLTARLKYRQQQHQVVVELINGKLKENYTRFVAGMNKINDVGECSEQTTLICDEGKSRLRFVKENLIANALALSEKHRRKQNLTHLRGLALQMKVIATLQQDTQRLLGERRYAEAAIAISKGLHKARSLGMLFFIRCIPRKWIVGLHGWVPTPGTAGHTKVHCERALYFNSTLFFYVRD